MSAQQLNDVIHRITATFGSWGPDTTIEQMRKGWDDLFADVKPEVGAKREPVSANGVKAEWVTAPGASADRGILYLHGGGFVLGSIKSHGDLAERLSRAARARVLIIDYRLAPEHPFPAPVEDAIKAYRFMLDQGLKPAHMAIAGDSAGGGLTFSTLLAIKNEKLPMPACATPLSPWVDLENSGETMKTKAADDPMVQKHMVDQMAATYAQQTSLRDPLLSPLHGDLSGLPPLLIQVGGRETLLDNATRIGDKAKKAGVSVEVDVWPEQVHVWQIFAGCLDEGEQAVQKLGAFMRKHMN